MKLTSLRVQYISQQSLSTSLLRFSSLRVTRLVTTRSSVSCLGTCSLRSGTMKSEYLFCSYLLACAYVWRQVEQAPWGCCHLARWCRSSHQPRTSALEDIKGQEGQPGGVEMFCVRIIVVLFMYYSFYPLVIGFHRTAMMIWRAWPRSQIAGLLGSVTRWYRRSVQLHPWSVCFR